MTSDRDFRGALRRPPGSTSDDTGERLRAIADRLRDLKREAAALTAVVLHIEEINASQDEAADSGPPLIAYDYKQVGAAIGLGETTVRAIVKSGKLRGVTVNGTLRVY